MADFRLETNLGARIRLARRERGFRTTAELANAIPGGNVTESILENIESGRKADFSFSQLLNIARGLNVPLSMLLAPIGRPDSKLDLANLSEDFASMTAAEFDCWLSATPASSYRPRSAAEREDVATLNSLREFGTLSRELERLRIVLEVQAASGDPDLSEASSEIRDRINRLVQEASRVSTLLASSGVKDISGSSDSNGG
jgi:transcriptional regulator with XRE-family HTH domain